LRLNDGGLVLKIKALGIAATTPLAATVLACDLVDDKTQGATSGNGQYRISHGEILRLGGQLLNLFLHFFNAFSQIAQTWVWV
jgi:hypothetical protein